MLSEVQADDMIDIDVSSKNGTFDKNNAYNSAIFQIRCTNAI